MTGGWVSQIFQALPPHSLSDHRNLRSHLHMPSIPPWVNQPGIKAHTTQEFLPGFWLGHRHTILLWSPSLNSCDLLRWIQWSPSLNSKQSTTVCTYLYITSNLSSVWNPPINLQQEENWPHHLINTKSISNLSILIYLFQTFILGWTNPLIKCYWINLN